MSSLRGNPAISLWSLDIRGVPAEDYVAPQVLLRLNRDSKDAITGFWAHCAGRIPKGL